MNFSGQKRNRSKGKESPKHNEIQNFQRINYGRYSQQSNDIYLKEIDDKINVLKHEIDLLNNKEKEKDKLINRILKENEILLKQNEIISKRNEIHSRNIQLLNDLIYLNKKMIKELKEENDDLKMKINELYPIVFGCKLIKLLKKLLEYMVNDPELSSGLIKVQNKVHLLRKLPSFDLLLDFGLYEILVSFNKLLEIIQSYSSECDGTIHYVNKNAVNNSCLRKRIKVFENNQDFFSYFNFSEKQRKILTKFIPPYLFETIDNWTFEEKMSKLLTKIL